jgi:hypothetical protein
MYRDSCRSLTNSLHIKVNISTIVDPPSQLTDKVNRGLCTPVIMLFAVRAPEHVHDNLDILILCF